MKLNSKTSIVAFTLLGNSLSPVLAGNYLRGGSSSSPPPPGPPPPPAHMVPLPPKPIPVAVAGPPPIGPPMGNPGVPLSPPIPPVPLAPPSVVAPGGRVVGGAGGVVVGGSGLPPVSSLPPAIVVPSGPGLVPLNPPVKPLTPAPIPVPVRPIRPLPNYFPVPMFPRPYALPVPTVGVSIGSYGPVRGFGVISYGGPSPIVPIGGGPMGGLPVPGSVCIPGAPLCVGGHINSCSCGHPLIGPYNSLSAPGCSIIPQCNSFQFCKCIPLGQKFMYASPNDCCPMAPCCSGMAQRVAPPGPGGESLFICTPQCGIGGLGSGPFPRGPVGGPVGGPMGVPMGGPMGGPGSIPISPMGTINGPRPLGALPPSSKPGFGFSEQSLISDENSQMALNADSSIS